MTLCVTQWVIACSTAASLAGADPGFAKGGADHGQRMERDPITEVWGQSPQRGPGQSSGWRVRGQAPLKLKAFRLFSYKKGQKF